ncbi:MAG: site-specific DNA-methyltransferase, partial [Deltaproteobacteria bacterium]|nr:site-specific DNA-methyltransferase [Deltaproteobacteria bacterium]
MSRQTPSGKEHHLQSGRCWLYTKEVLKKATEEGRIWFGIDENGVPRIKTYLNEKERGLTPETIWFAKDVSTTEKAKISLKELFEGYAVFETPKSVELLKRCIEVSSSKCDIVVDFFAGSCPTAHAVIDLNKEDNGKRRFIMIQLPEPCGEKSEAFKAGYKTIADIGKERIRRAAAKIKEEHPDYEGDLGFKVFKLDSSNIRAWNPDRNDLEGTLYEH